jgi:hypothetical protein
MFPAIMRHVAKLHLATTSGEIAPIGAPVLLSFRGLRPRFVALTEEIAERVNWRPVSFAYVEIEDEEDEASAITLGEVLPDQGW